ncbi:MAG: Gfo/Idh/MocA family oxidoreductase [Thermoguttaceae bacterium]|nr:Gfo/Idh/MocA family oxidoreductase [Thermoguttaceae bacterium]
MKRRNFLCLAAAGAAMNIVPCVLNGRALGLNGAVPPSERITMGLIGCGQHGTEWNLPLMFDNPMQQVIAVCDVDHERMHGASKQVEAFYNAQNQTSEYQCAEYEDFRDLVNRKEIDAVDIVTPDHWHVLLSVFAMKAGKDVICEKPTLTIEEGRILSNIQKSTQRVFQTASESRSIDEYIRIVNVVRNGLLGELKHIKVLLPPGLVDKGKINPTFEERDPPAFLDYQKWLGPAPVKPYVEARTHYNWRWNLDYSGGSLTDWGAHMINLAQWANNTEDTGPVSVQGTGDFASEDAVWNATPTFDLHYTYQNGVTMHVWSEVPGIKFEGTKGWILSRGWRGNTTASDDRLLTWLPDENDLDVGRHDSEVGKSGPSSITGKALGGNMLILRDV